MSLSGIYIRGWKDLSKYTGYHPRTLQRWHLQRAKLPFFKTHPYSKNSRWVITPDRVYVWLRAVGGTIHSNIEDSHG